MATPRRSSEPAALLLLVVVVATSWAVACRPEAGGPQGLQTPLRLGIYSNPLGLDPHHRDEFLTFSVLLNVYEGLVSFDDQLRIQPSLAINWGNPSDLTWRFDLRPGVSFHDGRALTAEDVAFSLDRARHHPMSNIGTYLLSVQEIRVIGDLTLEIITDRPYPILLNKLARVLIVPRGAPDEIVDPVGTGPYRVASFEPGERLELEAFEGHWGGPPAEPWVHLLPLTDGQRRLESLLSGETDFILDLAPEHMARVEGCAQCRVVTQDSLAVEYLHLRTDVAPFDDRRVREAIHLALDRQDLVDRMFLGQGRPAGQMVAPSVFGYAPGLEPPARDLSRARRLMEEAGHLDGLELTLEVREGRQAGELQRQLAEAGIRATVRSQPWEDLFPRLIAGEVAFYYGAFLAATADASDLLDSKVHTRDSARAYGDTNFSFYSNPDLDALIESSGVTLDMRVRRQALQQSMHLIQQDLELIPLLTSYHIHGLRAEVEWRPRLDGRVLASDLRRVGGRG